LINFPHIDMMMMMTITPPQKGKTKMGGKNNNDVFKTWATFFVFFVS